MGKGIPGASTQALPRNGTSPRSEMPWRERSWLSSMWVETAFNQKDGPFQMGQAGSDYLEVSLMRLEREAPRWLPLALPALWNPPGLIQNPILWNEWRS